MILSISEHAALRARQRLGWKGRSLRRMIPRVLRRGVWPSAAPAELRSVLDGASRGMWRRFGVVYSEHAFVFGFERVERNLVLITILPLRSGYRHLLPQLKLAA